MKCGKCEKYGNYGILHFHIFRISHISFAHSHIGKFAHLLITYESSYFHQISNPQMHYQSTEYGFGSIRDHSKGKSTEK
jgi:hypothetical protein